MIYLQLFWSFFKIGLFSIGGGYAAMPLISQQVVDNHGWLSMTEFADVVTISQMTPGPIAINSASFIGTRVAGLGGAIVATLGCVLPSYIIVLTLAYICYKYREVSVMQGVLGGLRPAVVAMIGSAGLSLLSLSFWGGKGFSFYIKELDFIAVGIFVIALVLLMKRKMSPIKVMVISGVVGLVAYKLGFAI